MAAESEEAVSKTILLVGEGNFSFAKSMILTTNEVPGSSVVATDSGASGAITDGVQEVVEQLVAQGCGVLFEIDPTKLHTYDSICQHPFERVHWVCPHDGSEASTQTLPVLLKQFFSSADYVLRTADKRRIHIVLAQNEVPRHVSKPDPTKLTLPHWYQAFYYNIVEAAEGSRYSLVEVKAFSSEIYPGFVNQNVTGAPVDQRRILKEFIFEKVKLTAEEIKDRAQLLQDKAGSPIEVDSSDVKNDKKTFLRAYYNYEKK
uniref:25S rRNA (uridine-N(3))-methyltransferase BMT5-like domain-containing protein n=1 Tax=Palpitomonas bilix TaxID=652834 RepID=A0A7S3G6Q9_9EUKA|mmetsp:Transcript_31276/g.82047  ORF Transcript_31276/g.82047 Transcript_31276/m.82047 type:complete len:260 (+) Transcript_31276:65-844(+)